jgi:hypothetical protein
MQKCSDPMGTKQMWYAAINGLNYAGSVNKDLHEMHEETGIASDNHGSMMPATAVIDRFNLEEKVRKYLKKLDGLKLTIPISDIAKDLNMTEEAIVKIFVNWEIELDEEDSFD